MSKHISDEELLLSTDNFKGVFRTKEIIMNKYGYQDHYNLYKYTPTTTIVSAQEIITERETWVKEEKLLQFDLSHSKILNYDLVKGKNKVVSSNKKTNWSTILRDIWGTMNPQKILQTTTYNMIQGVKKDKGYILHTNLGLSIQNKCANLACKELLKMIEINEFSIQMSILLASGHIICYKN